MRICAYDHMRVHVEATLLAPEPMHSQLCHPSYEKCDYSKQLSTNLQPSFEIKRIILNNEELLWTDGEVPIMAKLDVHGLLVGVYSRTA